MPGAAAVLHGPDTREAGAPLLAALMLLLLVAYGALGRDVFFNHLAHAGAAEEDPVARALPYLRALLGLAAVAAVLARTGASALAAPPLRLAPFCALALASTLWSTDPKGTLRDAGTLAVLWIALPTLADRLGLAATARVLLNLVAVVLVASAALAILAPEVGRHSGDEFIQFSHAGRWRGLFGHKNGLGPWAALGSVFLFTHAGLLGGPRAWLWLARASALACLAFAGSATALVLAGLLWAAWIGARMTRRLTPGAALALTLAAALPAALLLASPLLDRALDLLGRGTTLSGRTEIWALALDRIRENPWFGAGYQRFGGADFLAEAGLRVGQALPGPESGYLALLLDLGLVGALLLAWPVLAALRDAVAWLDRARREDRAALGLLLMMLVAALAAAVTETGALVCNGSPGVLAFAALLTLLALPRPA